MGQQSRNTLVNETGFFVPGNHLNGEAQNALGVCQKDFAVVGFAQGLCGHGTDLVFFEAVQTLGKARQTGPAALHGVQAEVFLAIQAIALAHGFFEVLHAFDVARLVSTNFHAKAVGAQVQGGEEGTVLHAARGSLAPWFR